MRLLLIALYKYPYLLTYLDMCCEMNMIVQHVVQKPPLRVRTHTDTYRLLPTARCHTSALCCSLLLFRCNITKCLPAAAAS